MGTDTTERTKPCPCGQGEILITTTTPDHGWISAYNVHHSFEIKCRPCSAEYVLDGSRVVRRSERSAELEARGKHRTAYDALGASAPMAEVKQAFGRHLDDMPSVAAIHRYLKQHGLESYEIGTFRKRWTGGQKWAADHVRPYNLKNVLGLLNRDSAPFDAELQRLQELETAIPAARTVMSCLS